MDFNASVPNMPAIGSSIPHGVVADGSNVTVSSMSYHNDGNHLFVATEKNSKITIIDAVQTGKKKGTFACDREGVSVVAATHNDHCILSTGKKQNTIQYWSLHDNKILRKFRGHTSNVHEISLCPTDDTFLSSSCSSQDDNNKGAVRMWNLREAGCIAKLDLPADKTNVSSATSPKAVYDHTGMIFSIMAEMPNKEGNYVHLYDVRNYSGGAFAEFKLTTDLVQNAMKTHRIIDPPTNGSLTFNKIDFNLSGDRMLLQSTEGFAVVLDGFEGTIQRIFQPPPPPSNNNPTTAANNSSCIGVSSCFTPDGKSLLMGNNTGTIDVYDIQSGTAIKRLDVINQQYVSTNPDSAKITAITCNPKYKQIASGCTDTCLWIW